MAARIDPGYRLALGAFWPLAAWGRLHVEGLDQLPDSGPVLLVGNHDCQWDPIAIGFSCRRRRHVRSLAKSSLWEKPGLGPILDSIDQIPIVRGGVNFSAIRAALQGLRNGDCIGIFPEGTVSAGNRYPARRGVGWLAGRVPEATIVLVAVEGATDLVRFPTRPRIRIRFLLPRGGQATPGEEPEALASRLVDELRELVPPVAAGRG